MKLSSDQNDHLLGVLKIRFHKNLKRHENIEWQSLETFLKANPEKIWSLNEMENTGGEPDVISLPRKAKDEKISEIIFFDCSDESPKGRRSLCYDQDALRLRKENKPKDSVMSLAKKMGVEVLSEDQYRMLQQFGIFDTKTSSWVKSPESIRKLGGALFCDRRYDTVFVYHNSAESYYAARGFRACLKFKILL